MEKSNQGRDYQEIANQVTITTELSNNQTIIIRIRDNGTGMSPDLQKKVFDYLFTTKEVGKGTGLGLAIARQIITEKHGGLIQVNSTLGQGTEFILTLPIKANPKE